jgi:predicted outer membrane repeat protein
MINGENSPLLINCTFSENSAAWGGGMYNGYNNNTTLTNCAFNENSGDSGGGMYNCENSMNLAGCTFSGNFAEYGGGINCEYDANLTLENCIFSGNEAEYGGGVFCDSNSTSVLTNCSIVDNQVTSSGGGFYNSDDSSTTLTNCIVWNNALEQIVNDAGGNAVVTYSNVQGGWSGQGNIDNDPLFADPSNGDYHLKSRGGRWDPVSQTWVRDGVTSPCVDAGDPTITSFSLEPVPNGGRINMGAYGGTAEASKRP